MTDIKLPPLPPPFKKAVYATSANTKSVRDGVEMGGYEKEPPLFDDAQMHEYARAAVKADRKRRGEPAAYISHTSEGDILGWERQFDAPSHTPLYTAPQPAEQPECGCCGQTDRCDDDCDAVVIGGHRTAEQQPAPDLAM